MDCEQIQERLLYAQRGLLPAPEQEAVTAHLRDCAACQHAAAVEQELSAGLARLPRHSAPASLHERLRARHLPHVAPARPRPLRRWAPALLSAACVAVLLLASIPAYYEWEVIPRRQQETNIVREAVNDHLRLLISDHPLSVESNNMHNVKPWFAGRLDFTPHLEFAGDEEFPLAGGAVAYFLDRRAAGFLFKRRLHQISLFVVQAEGLAFPRRGEVPLGRLQAHAAFARGFGTLLWRDGELGYLLVSDVNMNDLTQLARKLTGAP